MGTESGGNERAAKVPLGSDFSASTHVLGLEPFLGLHQVEFDLFAILEAAKALALDAGVVDKDVFVLLASADETEALLTVEPFDCAGNHRKHLRQEPASRTP